MCQTIHILCEYCPKITSALSTECTIFKKGVANPGGMNIYSPHENVTANITESVAENLSRISEGR